MSEKWIRESERLLKGMKELSSKEKRDRLEVVNSMLFTLNILERSVNGWRLWIRNLSLMSRFTLEELSEMEQSLGSQVQPFVEYDIEVSRKWREKFPQIPRVTPIVKREEERRGIYV